MQKNIGLVDCTYTRILRDSGLSCRAYWKYLNVDLESEVV
jgi:hypothetical protein